MSHHRNSTESATYTHQNRQVPLRTTNTMGDMDNIKKMEIIFSRILVLKFAIIVLIFKVMNYNLNPSVASRNVTQMVKQSSKCTSGDKQQRSLNYNIFNSCGLLGWGKWYMKISKGVTYCIPPVVGGLICEGHTFVPISVSISLSVPM